ncbi:hypothetical protein JIN85_17105 [Luteolibacter pohnpeiensis]|uniref:Uncharacterized protein n=1 Tax=Luteolibacter pohnpeiensis TaxID=454153 RepID=A0A934SDI5_9BACT|nr:hypothetical protein [Luteolibacter pohnpeiensis]MBK1884142.1 hypothetical protein [Luteolibacter pohnpeiensis]
MHAIHTIVEFSALAQISIPEGFKSIMTLLRAFAALLAVAALIYAGVTFATGRVEASLWGIIAAGILGLSVALVKVIFDGTGDTLGF